MNNEQLLRLLHDISISKKAEYEAFKKAWPLSEATSRQKRRITIARLAFEKAKRDYSRVKVIIEELEK